MNKIFMITGGAGFIGSRLAERLINDGNEVHLLDVIPIDKALRLKKIKNNKNFHYTKGDIQDKEFLKSWYVPEADVLFHLASVVGVEYYIKDPLSLIDIVIGGTRNLLELALKNNTRVLFTSTSEVYGKNPKIPWSENNDRVLGPTSIDRWSYSSSKAVCEHMLFALKRSHGLKFTTVRFFNVYGPGQSPIFVASKSLHQALNNKAPLIYDNGKQTRCFTYVDDAIEAVLLASDSEKAIGEVFNIGSNVETSISELVNLCIEYSGNQLEPKVFITQKEYGELYEDIPRRIPDPQKAFEKLGWTAETSLSEGLKLNINWIKENDWWLK